MLRSWSCSGLKRRLPSRLHAFEAFAGWYTSLLQEEKGVKELFGDDDEGRSEASVVRVGAQMARCF